MLEQQLQPLRALNGLFHFLDLTLRQSFPTWANRSVISQTVEKDFDLIQRKAHLAGKTNEKHSVQRVGRVASLASYAFSRLQYAHAFVVPDRRRIQTAASREFPDLHRSSSSKRLDLKSTLSLSILHIGLTSPIGGPMNTQTTSARKPPIVAALIAVLILGGVTARALFSKSFIPKSPEQTMTTQTRFYCNMKALSGTERIKHLALTGKLIMFRKEIVESEKGYEFQFSPSTVSLADLASWVSAESKCCPFFDFHIDLEKEGRLVCLRLTGEDGIKEFIRSEFKVAMK
jgi:hypothetical protein